MNLQLLFKNKETKKRKDCRRYYFINCILGRSQVKNVLHINMFFIYLIETSILWRVYVEYKVTNIMSVKRTSSLCSNKL